MDRLGHVYPNADGRHLFADRTFVGVSMLQTHYFNSPDDRPGLDSVMHSIMLAVPASMHRQVIETRPPTSASATLVPRAGGTGFGLLVVRAAADVVVAVADIAGRADLADLQAAAERGRVTAGIASNADPNVTPLLAVSGIARALSEARPLRRLAARELVDVVTDVRSILRGPAAHAFLGVLPPTRWDTLTVNVCPL